jgi:ethanolamine utilization protein EutQ (cupin superfamily)
LVRSWSCFLDINDVCCSLKIELEKKQVNTITGQVMKTLTSDLKDLWSLYEQLLSLLMKESNSESGTTEKSSFDSKNKKDVLDALNFYKEHYEKVSN